MKHAPKLIKIDGEWTYVPLTEEEIAEREQAEAEFFAQEAQREEARKAHQAAVAAGRAKLAKLGLTDVEIDALLP